jgi:hypothetical protein
MANISIKNGIISRSMLVGNAFYDPTPTSIEYLVIAGGGGGAKGTGSLGGCGGSGAGGYRCSVSGELTGGGGSAESPLSIVKSTTYTVTVGAGGVGRTTDAVGAQGSNSVLGSITSTGGGGGGSSGGASQTGGAGGSSGGGAGNISSPGTRTASPVQGYNGGASSNGNGGKGGGGAGAEGGQTTSNVGGAGGNGLASSITGTSVTRGGGGGGGAFSSNPGGTGGTGGGGAGGGTGVGVAGTANTGGGAGGNASTANGVNGGSGVVILRYPDNLSDAVSTTGSPTLTNTGGYKIYTFTGSGSITW